VVSRVIQLGVALRTPLWDELRDITTLLQSVVASCSVFLSCHCCLLFSMFSNSLTYNLMVQDGGLLHLLDRKQNVPGPVWCKTGLGRET
jgi:hypothetical protein